MLSVFDAKQKDATAVPDLRFDKASLKASVTARQAALKEARRNLPKHAALEGEGRRARPPALSKNRMSAAALSRVACEPGAEFGVRCVRACCATVRQSASGDAA